MKELIDELFSKQSLLKTQLTEVNDAISALQKICTHDFEYDGSDSHNHYVKCKMCRKTEKE